MSDSGLGGTGRDHDFLSAYLDGELGEPERVEVEARLAASSELRAELVEVRTARAAVRSLPALDPPEGFWESVRATVRAVPDGDAPVVPLDARRRRVRTAWMGAAAAVVAVVAVVVIPGRSAVRPDVTAVATQHGASSSNAGDAISSLVPVGPLVGRR